MITKEYLQKELATRIKGIKPGVETTTDLVIGEMKSILVLVEALQDDEKKYKEALERIKEYYNMGGQPSRADLECIFPELRESEDERIRRTLVEYFSPKVQLDLVRGVPIQKIRDWLENQKEQKPAEWSEEDNKKIHFLSRLIEIQVNNGEYCFGGNGMVSKQEAIEMLKSLRPSWKPKKEQMKALGASIVFHKNEPFVERLRELYNELQKL